MRTFLSLGNERIAKRYCHLHPEADPAAVTASLQRVSGIAYPCPFVMPGEPSLEEVTSVPHKIQLVDTQDHKDVYLGLTVCLWVQTQKHFRWAGADVFITTTERGHRRSVVIETNSCPSGQKSMPPLNESDEQVWYF